MDLKRQTRKTNKETQEQGLEPLVKVREQVEESHVETEEPTMKPLDEVLKQAETAYRTYIKA